MSVIEVTVSEDCKLEGTYYKWSRHLWDETEFIPPDKYLLSNHTADLVKLHARGSVKHIYLVKISDLVKTATLINPDKKKEIEDLEKHLASRKSAPKAINDEM